jgi:hypothetical protein
MLVRSLWLGFGLGCVAVSCGNTASHSSDSGGSGGLGAGAGAGQGGSAGIGGSNAVAGQAAQDAGGASGSGDAEGGADSGGTSAAGEAGSTGEPITAGLVVVATTVTGATADADRYFVVLLDPTDGHELGRTQTELSVLGMAYEAARDKWFIFTGTSGQGGAEPNGPLLVGTMTSAGFSVEQTVMVPKPTNQNTIAVLNQRILYRTTSHVGVSQVGDTLALVDTSAAVKIIGKLNLPYQYALVSAVGAPSAGANAGGRVFFLHDNLDDATDNCVAPTVGTEEACTVYSSSLFIAATDTNLTLPLANIASIAQIDRDGSDAALGIQPSGNTVVLVVPPRRAVDTHASVFRFDASTGAAVGSALQFSLETATKKIDPNNSITIPTVAVDPCANRLFTGELANAGLLYAVPLDAPTSVVAFDPASHDGIVGAVAYEPFTHTLISYVSNPDNPTLSGLQIGDPVTAPQITVRGTPGAALWNTPPSLVPAIVSVKNPLVPPCE